MGRTAKYFGAETLTAEGANGISYAYRRLGPAGDRDVIKFLDS